LLPQTDRAVFAVFARSTSARASRRRCRNHSYSLR
jgi:hypothetical protein